MSSTFVIKSSKMLTRDKKDGIIPPRCIDGTVSDMPKSALGTFLREEMRRRGLTQTEFAAEVGIQKSTMSRLVNGVVETPDLTTLMRLADHLNVSLSRLLELIGIPVEKTTPGDVAVAERLALLVDSIPWLAPVVEQIASLPEDDQRSLLAYMDFLRQRNQGQTT
jgi:transcriptional regulator with XRE-family HTH domain